MTKNAHRSIQLILLALCLCVCGFYYYYYNKNSRLDDHRRQLWTKLQNHAISRQEYDRLWDPEVEQWKASFAMCELLEIPVVALSFLSVVNLIVYKQKKNKVPRMPG